MINRQAVYDKFKGHCAYCGTAIMPKQMQVDHIYPKRNGGTDDIANLNPACRACNCWKTAMDIELFRSEISNQVERLRRYSSAFRMAERYSLVSETKQDVSFYFERHKQ